MKAPAGACWIGSAHPFDLTECYLNFRVDLDLSARPHSALLHLSADSRYRLWINGQFVARGPERSWPSRMAVDARDVAVWLKQGKNRIAVQVYSPGYSHFAYVHRATCGLIGWLEVEGETRLVSNGEWRVRRDPSWSPQVPRVSVYGSGAEMRDMALAEDWVSAEPAGWAAARIVQPAEGPIWAGLRPRVTPLLLEEARELSSPWETRFGAIPPGSDLQTDPHLRLRTGYAALPLAPVPEAIPPGHCAVWVFDLGESCVCVAGVTITASKGDRLSISYAEKLRDGALLFSDPQTYCRMRPTDQSILRDGRQEVEGFSLRGGRYVIFHLETSAKVTSAPRFHLRQPRYPLQAPALPDLGDPVLNAVAEMCRRTTLNCLQDGFVDSVWRESSQWLGDAVAQSFALAALAHDPRPLRLAIEMAAEGAAVDGVLPSVLPGEVPSYVVTDYNFAWVELLDSWSRHPDAHDDSLLRRLWPVLWRMLERFAADIGSDGLTRSQPGRRLFLDWSPMVRTEPNLTYNLRHLHALQLAVRLGETLGAPEITTLRARAGSLASAIRSSFLQAENWRESPDCEPASQLALAFLILTGLVSGPQADALADAITVRSLDPDDHPAPEKLVLASPFMHHYIFQALRALAREPDIRQIIALRWGRWAAAGEPTTWENWAIDFPDGSACHGFSAHPLGWLFSPRRHVRDEPGADAEEITASGPVRP